MSTLSIDRDPERGSGQRIDRAPGRGDDGAEGAGGRLGQELAEISAATLHLAAELRPLLDGESAAALDHLVRDGGDDACRIAVIGQVKAGKSTLINALIRRPGFLPTDVNPWTAVVTNLHFGRRSDAGAVYQFFDEVDWQHLAAGGRLFELSRRLGIELDAYMLANQVRQMRERAEQRLGQQFRLLLGKQHRFQMASAEMLERYVCVGDVESGGPEADAAGGPAPDAGRFADITKSADLYFDLDPFACPVTIVDTPGTNDPFLVRDEISREALKSADAYVVVLNAQQALSSGDLDLLRLLHGLQKSRLVVFVNRVDLLNDPEADGAAVAAHIRSRLASEFPGAAIPIIAGSAIWAQSAATPDGAASRILMARRGAPGTAGDAAAVMRSSGLGELAMMLSRLIARGPAMLRMQRRQNVLRDMVSKLDLALRGELLLLDLHASVSSEDDHAAAQRRAQAAETLRRISAVSANIETRVDLTNADLQRAQVSAIRRLDAALRAVIRRHAAAARDTLLALPRFSRDHVWRYPTLPLRQELERTFQTVYWEAAGRLRGIERTANAEILGQIGNLVPANEVVGEDAPIHSIDPEPSISALGQTVAVELDSQWRAWWHLWQGHRQQADELKQILLADFTPVVDALVHAAETEIAAHVSISAGRFSQLRRDLVAMLNRRKLDIDAERGGETMRKPGGPAAETAIRQKRLEQSIEHCAGIADALKLLMGRSAVLGPGETVPPA